MVEITSNMLFAFAKFVACTLLVVEAKVSDRCVAQLIEVTYGTVGGCCSSDQFYDVDRMTCRKCPYGYTNCVKNTRSRCLNRIRLKLCPLKTTLRYPKEDPPTVTVDNPVHTSLHGQGKLQNQSRPPDVASDAEVKSSSHPTRSSTDQDVNEQEIDRKSSESSKNISEDQYVFSEFPTKGGNLDNGQDPSPDVRNITETSRSEEQPTRFEKRFAHLASILFILMIFVVPICVIFCVDLENLE